MRISNFTYSIYSHTGVPKQCNKRIKISKRHIDWKGRNNTVSVNILHYCLSRKSQNSIIKLLELVSGFRKDKE